MKTIKEIKDSLYLGKLLRIAEPMFVLNFLGAELKPNEYNEDT